MRHARPSPTGSRPSRPDTEPTSFQAVFRAHYAGLCEFVSGYVRSRETAGELVQDLSLRLWRLQGTPQSPPLTKAYLYTAARNRAIRYLRHSRVEARWQQRAAQEAEEPTASADDALDWKNVWRRRFTLELKVYAPGLDTSSRVR